jgi:hypothetical protein
LAHAYKKICMAGAAEVDPLLVEIFLNIGRLLRHGASWHGHIGPSLEAIDKPRMPVDVIVDSDEVVGRINAATVHIQTELP